ncbi:MAG: LysM peptidoglycan-binding domain-containing protein [Vicingaceae bacterium]|nr:LysM peptidoglycan-binding domain-containing protein [Vicingaceae bacterium]
MIKQITLTLIILFLFSTFLLAQKKTKESVYKIEYEEITKNTYSKRLIEISGEKPPKHINYKGKPITIDTTFLFAEKPFSHSFPTQFSENHYVPYYFSAKAYKMPTAMSLLHYYQSIIDSNLTYNNLPKELNLVPLVCSAFNPFSSNGIGGEGFWHLYYPQAIKYGLTVNENIDERRDFNKATQAATRYLKDLHTLYNNWELTLAAYSCGVVNVNKAMQRTNKKDYKAIYELLPTQTNDFVNAFVAMLLLSNYDDFEAVQLNPIVDADTVFIAKKLDLKAIDDVLKADSKEIQFLNPKLLQNLIPKNTVVKFPTKLKTQFLAQKDSIYFYQDSILYKPTPKEKIDTIPTIEEGEFIVYKIKSGDVLGIIAEKHKVTVTQLQSWNNLSGTRIEIGQQLKIYGTEFKQDAAPEPVVEKDSTAIIQEKKPKEQPVNSTSYSAIYTVKSGDNLWIIAKKYPGISADDIMKFNKIDANLKIGQELKIPSK